MTATPAQVAHYASLAAQAEQHVAGLGVCRALHHVVGEVGYDNAEELLQSLDIAAECAEELRLPDLPSEREQADADARDRAERVYEARRDV